MKDIKILVLDVDGTLTNGKIYIDDKDNSFKAFNVKDGFALVNWLKLGGEVVILTGKKSNIVERRAKELGIKYVIQGSKNKTQDLKNLLKELNITFENTAYMGDDLNDLGVIYDSQKRYELAIKMFLKAAENGDEDAVLNIGLMYEDRDMYNEAKEWYKKFAELGNQKALKKYNELKDKY